MSEDKSISVLNLGKLSKPANTLIKKVSSAVGGIFEPWQIKRVAKAKAEAELIKAKADIEITDLHRRAMHRFIEEEALRQENMEKITKKALPLLKEDSDPSAMGNDWVTNFFDKSRIISDEEMQSLWSKILAGEANAPGTYSKRTVNFLSDLDKKDAELFQTLCRFGWIVREFTPLIFNTTDKIYSDLGLHFNSLTHLESIGLIKFSEITGFQTIGLPRMFNVFYCNQPLGLVMEKNVGNQLSIGIAILTKVGQELATICEATVVDGFYDYVKEKWTNYTPHSDVKLKNRK